MKTWINPFPSYAGYRPGMGAGYARYAHDFASYTPLNVANGSAFPLLRSNAAAAATAGAFFGTRLIWNGVRVPLGLPGMRYLQVETYEKDNQNNPIKGWIADIRDEETLAKIIEVEQKEADELGHLYDFRQFGFGLLNENNGGKTWDEEGCPFTTDDIWRYFHVMRHIWGRKLAICVGGNSTWVHPFLQRVGEMPEPERPQMVFQDNFMREGWTPAPGCEAFDGGTSYTQAEQALSYKPLIWWAEVSGGPNDRPDEAECGYKQFVIERGTFFANMGAWPNYPGTNAFEAAVGAYAGERLEEFLRWSAGGSVPGDGGGVPPVDPEYVTREEFEALEARVESLAAAIATKADKDHMHELWAK